jgi:hypothetical protein
VRREGPLQRELIRHLQELPDRNEFELARLIHQRDASINERRALRKALATLIKKGLIQRSGYYHNGACYVVTHKALARPAKTAPTFKPKVV